MKSTSASAAPDAAAAAAAAIMVSRYYVFCSLFTCFDGIPKVAP